MPLPCTLTFREPRYCVGFCLVRSFQVLPFPLVRDSAAGDCNSAPFCLWRRMKVRKQIGVHQIQCDRCSKWLHFICEGFFTEEEIKDIGKENYVCRR
jgi:hypothetical protein